MSSTTEIKIPKTMKAVVVKGPYEIVVEEREVPVPGEGEVLCKVTISALCGSDLHIYRGHQPLPKFDFIMGHEFTGVVASIGSGVKNFKVGDKVVSPFTVSCGECFYCKRGWTSRCDQSKLFGSPILEGGQAEWCKVPLADSTLFHAPTDVADENLILMCDILPTGFFAAKNAWSMLNEEERKDSVAVVVGCGPVGLCAITAATERFSKVYAIDSVPERLEEASRHGAQPINLTSKSPTPEELIKSATNGRGADVVLEIVGAPDALQLAIDLIRPGGVVASAGLHTHDINLKGLQLYNKNIRFQFGRCPARALFPEALELLRKVTKASSPNVFDSFVQKKVKLEDAPEYYKLFNDRKVGKTVFVTDEASRN